GRGPQHARDAHAGARRYPGSDRHADGGASYVRGHLIAASGSDVLRTGARESRFSVAAVAYAGGPLVAPVWWHIGDFWLPRPAPRWAGRHLGPEPCLFLFHFRCSG